MLYSTEAIILQTHNYGDTSLICNLFSKDFGKLALIAKGARTLKNPNRAILQPLHYIKVEYYYKPNRNMQLLKEASINNHYHKIKKNYSKLTYSYMCIDILNKISQFDNPCNIIFRLIKSTLHSINANNAESVNLFYLFYQIQLLKYLGFQPNIKSCSICNKNFTNAHYNKNVGQLICSNCGQTKELKLNNNTINLIKTLENTHINDIPTIKNYNASDINIIKKFFIHYITYHIFDISKIKSLQLIN